MTGVFAKNTLITFITRLTTAVFNVGIIIIIARILGPEGQGLYSLIILFPSLLLIFTSFGINPASVFLIGKGRYSPKEVFGNGIIFNAVISVFTVLIGFIVISFFNENFFPGVEKKYLFLILPLIPLTLFFDLGSQILLGIQKIKKYNIISFLQSGLFLGLIGVLLFQWSSVGAAIFAQIFSFLLVGIILFFIVKKEIGGISLKFNKNYFKESFSYGIKMHLGGIFSFLHYRIDLFLLNIFINPLAVGLYYAAAKLAEGIWVLSTSAATMLFTRVASEKDEKGLKEFTPIVCRNILLITLLIVVLLFFLSDWIITLFYSEDFLDSIRPFQILLIGTLAISGWRILANDIAGRGKPLLNTYVIGASAIMNIILNILWIPKYGITGAAWATAISYFSMLISTLFIYRKVSGNRLKDIILFQKADFNIYKSFLLNLKK